MRHGKVGAPIELKLSIGRSPQEVVFTITNQAGPKHLQALALQAIHGANFLLQPETAYLNLSKIGNSDSDFRGCIDISNAAQALQCYPSLVFLEDPEVVVFELSLPQSNTGIGAIKECSEIVLTVDELDRATPALDRNTITSDGGAGVLPITVPSTDIETAHYQRSDEATVDIGMKSVSGCKEGSCMLDTDTRATATTSHGTSPNEEDTALHNTTTNETDGSNPEFKEVAGETGECLLCPFQSG